MESTKAQTSAGKLICAAPDVRSGHAFLRSSNLQAATNEATMKRERVFYLVFAATVDRTLVLFGKEPPALLHHYCEKTVEELNGRNALTEL